MSRRHILLAISIVFFAASVDPARADLRPIDGLISWILRPEHMPVDAAERQTKLGEFLFLQPLHLKTEALLAVGSTGNMPFLGKVVQVPLDGQRFGAVTVGVSNTAFCSVGHLRGKGQRLCLVDANNDGQFDYQTRAFGLDGGAPFARMLSAGNGGPAAIPYQVQKVSSDAQMYAGLILKRKNDGYELSFAISEKGKPRSLILAEQDKILNPRRIETVGTKFTAAQLPVKVGVYGAVVEILRISEGNITYSVHKDFDVAETIVVSRAGVLPVPR